MIDICKGRLVATFDDSSELFNLLNQLDDESYVLIRPEMEGRKFTEVMIVAGSDEEALAEVLRVAEDEIVHMMLVKKLSKV
ncbi:MAG: hypothetical protein VR65_06615 [Desulfobulbaceae bacterium BRH_c16a]|nr:MAG: hypothetical protein VR65_25405 [Desulfobulbaceae bacterium BRH_c16a]KJS02298.1 MAG: hypothetical protein VR65_06615 [Desulfobulbaceae bacterium BRH_c16a]